MTGISWEKRVNSLRQELASIKSGAYTNSVKFQELRKQAECCKVQFVAYQLEARRKSLACGRGAASVTKNKKGLPLALGIAAGASFLAGMITKDRSAAASAAISGLNGALRGIGETDWAVCLGINLAIVPRDDITPGQIWVTWDSLNTALCEFGERAKSGARLGNLDDIISELWKSKRLVVVINSPHK